MRVDHIPCGEFANASELDAITLLSNKLRSLPGDQRWVLLSNVASSVNPNATPDEIDLVAIGPTGVFVVEIKHWDRAFLKSHAVVVESEAVKLNDKIRRLASKIRKAGNDVGFLAGRFLLTRESQPWKQNRPTHNGSLFFVTAEWQQLLDLDRAKVLNEQQVEAICRAIQPLTAVTLTGQVRRLANARNLELVSNKTERFHRIFRGEHARLRDKIVLHLFDLSATVDAKPEVLASREYDILHRLQQFSCVPRLLDSFQEVPEYPGELYYFSLVDPCAPPIAVRASDKQWSLRERCQFAASACRALASLHKVELGNVHFVHRNLTPHSILVGHECQPIFTNFHWSRSTDSATVAHAWRADASSEPYLAPEIKDVGIGRADQRSDVFALCSSLDLIFIGLDGNLAEEARVILAEGTSALADNRAKLDDIAAHFDSCLGTSTEERRPLPAARFWSEGLRIPFNDQEFRLVSALGSGSFGTTFKVVQLLDGEQEGASFVGKVVFDQSSGERALKAYRKVRAYTTGSHMAAVFEIASMWQENSLLALLKWVNGSPVHNLIGLLELYAEELEEGNAVKLAGRWISNLCEALKQLHSAGLVHGDVSAKNILESNGNVALVDYDLVLQAGEQIWSTGTPLYSPPEAVVGAPAMLTHDIYSLGAVFFHLLLDRYPFTYAGNIRPENGLNWENVQKEQWGWVGRFLDKATSPRISERFASAHEAVEWIRIEASSPAVQESAHRIAVQERTDTEDPTAPEAPIRPQRVPWLSDLLSTYPGSPRGSIETRGLDTEFASDTYVPTALEDKILKEVQRRETQLVILCGNAGDGKTAFLQHLASRLGLPVRQSAERVWEGRLPDGLKIVINLDGAASFKDRSSDALLDEIFAPFQNGPASDARVHLLAVNDGRLLQWADDYEERKGTVSKLTQWIYDTLLNQETTQAGHIRLISLNERSLVGSLKDRQDRPSTEFLDNLLTKLLGGEKAVDIWKPCQTCSSAGRCTAYNSVRLLTTDDESQKARSRRVRERISEALQAVHHRGQVHITTRELRGALTYIFFDTYFCDDLHNDPELVPPGYWDRAFDAGTSLRQGEVLNELKRFDPALESHPLIDRYLRSKRPSEDGRYPARYPGLSLASSRRRAFFEWSPAEISAVAGRPEAHGMSRGEHLRLFARVPGMSAEERKDVCARLCSGISRLEHLPRVVLKRADVVPLKVQPRTPVETTFWVEKDITRFDLSAVSATSDPDLEWLHNSLVLTYRYQDNERVERLLLSSDLFSLLLDLASGYQLMDTSTDDVFATLSIFTQRLAEEDDREVFAYEPGHEGEVFHIRAEVENGIQKLTMKSLPQRQAELCNG